MTPSTAPNNKPPNISTQGAIRSLLTGALPLELITLATAIESPYAINATASSSATTGSRVFVTGPFVLYCFTIIIVDAAAVADAIAPSASAKLTLYPSRSRIVSTTSTAPTPSVIPITSGAFPTFFKKVVLNSAPIEKAMHPSASSVTRSILSINSSLKIFKQFGPISNPITRYPVTFGSRICLTILPAISAASNIIPKYVKIFKSMITHPSLPQMIPEVQT